MCHINESQHIRCGSSGDDGLVVGPDFVQKLLLATTRAHKLSQAWLGTPRRYGFPESKSSNWTHSNFVKPRNFYHAGCSNIAFGCFWLVWDARWDHSDELLPAEEKSTHFQGKFTSQVANASEMYTPIHAHGNGWPHWEGPFSMGAIHFRSEPKMYTCFCQGSSSNDPLPQQAGERWGSSVPRHDGCPEPIVPGPRCVSRRRRPHQDDGPRCHLKAWRKPIP